MIKASWLKQISEYKLQVTLMASIIIHGMILFAVQLPSSGLKKVSPSTTIELIELSHSQPQNPKPSLELKQTEPSATTVNVVKEQPVAPQEEKAGPIRIEQTPVFLKQVLPNYPRAERKHGRTANVILEAIIDKDGLATNIVIIKSGGRLFDQAAMTAIQQSRFIPASIMGKPVSAKIQVPYVFELKK